ncbi:bacillithiol biosynthesis cysteine-adding enzyme BshC [soil metagenome]
MKQEIAREPKRENAKLRISHLPFSDIPGQSQLFTEYLKDPVSLRRYYPNAVAAPADVAGYVPTVLANYDIDRNAVCDALVEINTHAAAGATTFDNIELLRRPDTVAVITGQQAGLFTGPLYTVYKALSAIKMAETLRQSGTNAVPIFWTATEDHDFDEVAETWYIGRAGELTRHDYRPAGYVPGVPVGSVAIDEGVSAVIGEIFADLPATEFSDEVSTVLSGASHAGAGFGDSFMATLARLFSKYGVILVDPLHSGLKHLASPLFEQAVTHADEIVTAITQRSRELVAEGYHAQVLVEEDHFPFFWHDEQGRRLALRKIAVNRYRAKDDGTEFTLADLEDIARTDPSRLSPGVMLRPAVQDFLFPTACYFGGGAEIAYFAQNSEAYRILGRPVTPILHRQSFTVVEARQRRVLEKLGLEIIDLFDDREQTALKLARTNISPDTARLFAEVEEQINTEFNRLDQAISEIDVTVSANLAKRRRKMIYHIGALRKKTLLAQVRKDETTGRQLDGVYSALMPNGGLQERTLNVFTFLNRYGLNFIDWIYDAIDLDDRDHRIIDL